MCLQLDTGLLLALAVVASSWQPLLYVLWLWQGLTSITCSSVVYCGGALYWIRDMGPQSVIDILWTVRIAAFEGRSSLMHC